MSSPFIAGFLFALGVIFAVAAVVAFVCFVLLLLGDSK